MRSDRTSSMTRPYDPEVNLGTLQVRPFHLLHPHPGRAARRQEASGWQASGRDLVRGPGVYLVTVRTPHATVRGLAVCVEVTDSLAGSGLMPHEAVHLPLVTRRLKALRTARVDREPVLLTHPGGGLAVSAAVASTHPLFSTESAGMAIDVAYIDDQASEIVVADLNRRAVLVADGHHRLAAAVAMAGEGEAKDEYKYVSALVVDSDDTPLTINPMHRIVYRRGPVPLGAGEVVEALRMTQFAAADAAPGAMDRSDAGVDIVVVDRYEEHTVRCRPDPGGNLPTAIHVVDHAISALPAATVRRLRDRERVLGMTSRRGAVAVVVPAATHADIFDTIGRGLLMPVKATSFEPKLPAGVIIRPHRPVPPAQ